MPIESILWGPDGFCGSSISRYNISVEHISFVYWLDPYDK